MKSFVVNDIRFSEIMAERLPVLYDFINVIGREKRYDLGPPRLMLVEPYAATDPVDYVLPQDSQDRRATLEALDYFGVDVGAMGLKTARQLRQECVQLRQARLVALCVIGNNDRAIWIMFIPLDLVFPEPVPSRESPGPKPPACPETCASREEETDSQRSTRLRAYEDHERLASTADIVNFFVALIRQTVRNRRTFPTYRPLVNLNRVILKGEKFIPQWRKRDHDSGR
jgi:hypothetical protein